MKKLLSIILVTILVLPVFGLNIFAAGDLTVSSPAEGTTYELGDTITITGTASLGDTVTASIASVSDSVVVSDGTYAIVIPTLELNYGRHELTVSNGSKVVKNKINIVGDVVKDYYNINSFTATNGQYLDSTGGYTYGLTVAARTGYVRVDETGDVLKMRFDPVNSTNNDLSNLYGNCGGYRLLNWGSKIPYTNRIVRTSYDIMFPSSGYGVSMLTLGGWSTGLISNADAGQWYTVTVEEDYTTAPEDAIGTLNIYVYKKGEGNPIITKGPFKIKSKSNTYDDFYIYPNRSSGAFTQAEKDAGTPVTMCHIDNLHANSYEPIPQITSAKYTAVTDENIESLVPVNATAIKLTIGGKGFKPETITADTVKLYVGGKLANASVEYDSETQVITVIPAQGALVEYADAKVVIDSTVATSATGTAIGRQIEYGFDIADENNKYFKISDVSFVSGSTKVTSIENLQTGDDIEFRIIVENTSGDERDMLLVMVIRDGNKQLRLLSRAISAEAGTNAYSVSDTLPYAETLNIKAIICDKWSILKPMSTVYTLK